MDIAKVTPEKILPPDEVSQAVQGVWHQLTSQANQQLEALKEEHTEIVNALQQQNKN